MTATILDGKALAAKLAEKLLQWRRGPLGGEPVRLVSLSLGESPATRLFLRNQARVAARVEIEFQARNLPAETSEAQLVETILSLNRDPGVTGILVQRPLPPHIDGRRIQSKVHPDKDVEGMNPANIGTILYRQPMLCPCTALAAFRILLSTGLDPKGAEAVVVGHSEIVGKPVAILLMNRLATTTVCHVGTKDLARHTREAEILVVAVGKAGLVRGDMIRKGATVIDIGINRVRGEDGAWKTVGDVDFPSALERAGAITPVPGGVGPVTVMSLMENTLRAAAHARGITLPEIEL